MSRKTVTLWLLASAFAVFGASAVLLEGGRYEAAAKVPEVFLIGLLMFAWYVFDSNERSYRRSAFLNLTVIAVPAVGVPYYLFRSRGLRKGAVAFGWLFLLTIGLLASTFVGAFVAFLPQLAA